MSSATEPADELTGSARDAPLWFDAPAQRPLLLSADGDWSAAELRSCAAAIAERLRTHAAGRVVIFGGVEPATLLVWLGAQLAGHVVTVLDRRLPADTIRSFVERIRPTFVCHLAGHDDLLALVDPGVETIRHDALVGALRLRCSSGALRDPGPLRAPGGPACTVYSSGSSGVPKEVLLSHEALGGYARLGAMVEPVSDEDVVGMVHPLSVVTGPNSLAQAWCTGRAVAAYDVHLDGLGGLVGWLAESRVTHVIMQTAILRSILGIDGLRASSLRVLTVGGEPLRSVDIERFHRLAPDDARLGAVFGMSECGLIGWTRLPAGRSGDELRYRPTDGTEVVVIDEHGDPLDVGEIGELRVTSRRLADGYLLDDHVDVDRFPVIDGRRSFLSGDLGRLHHDGSFEVVGRVDSRVKVRGYNVFPEAVEVALQALDDVLDAAVVGVARPGGGHMLVGYVVPMSRPLPSIGALRRALQTRVPDYCVPSVFVLLDALPKLGNGKCDRAILRDRAKDLSFALRPEDAPRTAHERFVHDLVAVLLGLPAIGVDDDLLDLGMDSLMIGELDARIATEFGRGVGIASLIRAPTISGIAARLASPADDDAASLVVLARSGAGQRVVLIPGAGASVGYLRPLARLLAEHGEVVGVMTGTVVSVNREARTIADALRGCASPLVLVGHSWGAWVAQDAARLLVERGHDVAGVVLLDALASARPTRRVAVARRVRARGALRADGLRADGLRADDSLAGDGARALASAAGDRRFAWHLATLGWHRPRRVDVDAVLVVADAGHGAEPTAWRQWFREVRVVEAPGSHSGLLVEPYVGELAARLREHWPR